MKKFFIFASLLALPLCVLAQESVVPVKETPSVVQTEQTVAAAQSQEPQETEETLNSFRFSMGVIYVIALFTVVFLLSKYQ